MYIKLQIFSEKRRTNNSFCRTKCENSPSVLISRSAYNRYLQKFVTTTVCVSYCIRLKTEHQQTRIRLVTSLSSRNGIAYSHTGSSTRWLTVGYSVSRLTATQQCSWLGDSRSLLLSNGTTTGGGNMLFAGQRENRNKLLLPSLERFQKRVFTMLNLNVRWYVLHSLKSISRLLWESRFLTGSTVFSSHTWILFGFDIGCQANCLTGY